jgi:hypothetical protein
LSAAENEEASDIIDSVTHNYYYDEERFNALCNTSMREFKAQYSRPFRVGNGQKGSHFRFETVGYSPAQPGETREMSRTLSFESRNVVDHTVSRKGFSMITDTGVTVKAIVNNLSFKGGFGGNDF